MVLQSLSNLLFWVSDVCTSCLASDSSSICTLILCAPWKQWQVSFEYSILLLLVQQRFFSPFVGSFFGPLENIHFAFSSVWCHYLLFGIGFQHSFFNRFLLLLKTITLIFWKLDVSASCLTKSCSSVVIPVFAVRENSDLVILTFPRYCLLFGIGLQRSWWILALGL